MLTSASLFSPPAVHRLGKDSNPSRAPNDIQIRQSGPCPALEGRIPQRRSAFAEKGYPNANSPAQAVERFRSRSLTPALA